MPALYRVERSAGFLSIASPLRLRVGDCVGRAGWRQRRGACGL